MEKEIWKDVKGYEGFYEVSNKGNVRSVDRFIKYPDGHSRLIKGKQLKHRKHKDGYLHVALTRNAKGKNYLIHRLVAMTFLENPFNKETVNHKDGIKSNNQVSNLEWSTRSEQTIHAYSTGLHAGEKNYGLKNGRAKITEEEVRQIRDLSGIGFSRSKVGKLYGISPSTVHGIVKGEIWKHII